jgi:hypothetical protein
MLQLTGLLAETPFWIWPYGFGMLFLIGYEIRCRKTSLGGLTIAFADSPVLFELIILVKALGAGLVCWLFWE